LKPKVFMDSSALIAGLASSKGASNVILALAEADLLALVVSEQVLVEVERNLQEKLPRALPEYRRFLAACPLERGDLPSAAEVAAARQIIHSDDAPILAVAMALGVDYLVTINRKHFLEDPEVAQKSHLRLGTLGDFLAWFRTRLEAGQASHIQQG
jgi:predicted nucleic acid-binding protein